MAERTRDQMATSTHSQKKQFPQKICFVDYAKDFVWIKTKNNNKKNTVENT